MLCYVMLYYYVILYYIILYYIIFIVYYIIDSLYHIKALEASRHRGRAGGGLRGDPADGERPDGGGRGPHDLNLS